MRRAASLALVLLAPALLAGCADDDGGGGDAPAARCGAECWDWLWGPRTPTPATPTSPPPPPPPARPPTLWISIDDCCEPPPRIRALLGTFDVVPAIDGCPGACGVPSLAVDAEGRTVVASAGGGLAVSWDDGRSFQRLPLPPLPPGAPERSAAGDPLVRADAEGRWHVARLVERPLAGAEARELVGVQVASTRDAGASWAANVVVPLDARPWTRLAGAERPWLAWDASGAMHLVATARPLATPEAPEVAVGSVALAAASLDGGVTFGAWKEIFEAAPGERVRAGEPVGAGPGRLVVPLAVAGRVEVAETRDHGATWVRHDPFPSGAPPATDEPPALARSRDGALHLAWRAEGRDVLLSTSAEGGGAWTAPRRVVEGAWGAPSLRAQEGALDVAWPTLDEDGKRVALALARLALDPQARSAGWSAHPALQAVTQAPPLASGADGFARLAWPDDARGAVLVASERTAWVEAREEEAIHPVGWRRGP